MDEFRDEVNKVKEAPLKEQIAYYAYYYKWHMITLVAIITVVFSIFRSVVTNVEIAFYAYLINSIEIDVDNMSLEKELSQLAAVDEEKERVVLDGAFYLDFEQQDTNFVTYQQKLAVMVGSSEVDMMITDVGTFENLSQWELFLDIRNMLSEEEVERYEPYFYYIDEVYFDQREELYSAGDISYVFPEYDPKDPSSMEKPVPVGIYLEPDSVLLEEYVFLEEEVVMAVVMNSKRLEITKEFMGLILN